MTKRVELEGPPVKEAPTSTEKYDVVALYLSEIRHAPNGKSHYILLDKRKGKANLLNPFTLKEVNLALPVFEEALQAADWAPKADEVAALLEKQALTHVSLRKQAPYGLIRELIAHYRGVPIEQVRKLGLTS